MYDFEGVLQLARNDAYIFGLEQSSSGMWEVQGEEWWDKNYFIYELLKLKKKKKVIFLLSFGFPVTCVLSKAAVLGFFFW